MPASAEETTMGSSSVNERKHSPPPDYKETDPYSESLSGSIAGELARDVGIKATTTNATPKRHKKESTLGVGGVEPTFAKGLIPMSMMGGDADDHDKKGGHYDMDTDPILQDNNTASGRFFVGFVQSNAIGFFSKHRSLGSRIITGIFLAGITIYLGFATAHSPYGAIAPLVFTGLGVLIAVQHYIKKLFGKRITDNMVEPLVRIWNKNWHILKWFVYPAPIFGAIIYLSVMMTQIRQLQSLSGFVFFFCIIWLTSKHPDKVIWRPVVWGYTLQFTMALIVLQWREGYIAIEWLSDYVSKIIGFGFYGAATIYGDPTMLYHPMLMMGLSLLIYMGALLSIMFYFGVTQLMASKLAWGMSLLMGTTAIETLGCAANILLNGMDVMLMLRPYLLKLTMSEFNCFLVGNNSTIAGFMFGLLIMYGAPPQHLISAAVMSAPATIAIAKLNYPETVPEKSLTKKISEIKMSKGTERNMFEAAANGSAVAGKTVMTVCVNYISFMSILEFINATLSWLGNRIGYPEFSFEWICSYVFFPIALLIGVDVSQCRQVAKVIGIKILTTEVYSYQILGDIYERGLIDDRSKALATYALCGFCSLSTVAIAVGVWQVVCPKRSALVARLMFRVMFQANISCFTTASVAGLFYSSRLAIFEESSGQSPLSRLIVWVMGSGFKLLS